MTDDPKPYVPEDGAVICLAGDVPAGWEARSSCVGFWWPIQDWGLGYIVEARPVRRTVTIELTEEDARLHMSNPLDLFPVVRDEPNRSSRLSEACRDALARLDQEDGSHADKD